MAVVITLSDNAIKFALGTHKNIYVGYGTIVTIGKIERANSNPIIEILYGTGEDHKSCMAIDYSDIVTPSSTDADDLINTLWEYNKKDAVQSSANVFTETFGYCYQDAVGGYTYLAYPKDENQNHADASWLIKRIYDNGTTILTTMYATSRGFVNQLDNGTGIPTTLASYTYVY